MKTIVQLSDFHVSVFVISLSMLIASPAFGISESGKSVLENLRSKLFQSTSDEKSDEKVENGLIIVPPIISPNSSSTDASSESSTKPANTVEDKEDKIEDGDKIANELPDENYTDTDGDVKIEEKKNPPKPASRDEGKKLKVKNMPIKEGGSEKLEIDPAAAPTVKRIIERLSNIRRKMEKPSQLKNDLKVPEEPPKIESQVEDSNESMSTSASESQTITSPVIARSLAEISDEELIKFAQENAWSKERVKKHLPPPTPPYRPKKKKTVESSKNENKKTTVIQDKTKSKPEEKTDKPKEKKSRKKAKTK